MVSSDNFHKILTKTFNTDGEDSFKLIVYKLTFSVVVVFTVETIESL